MSRTAPTTPATSATSTTSTRASRQPWRRPAATTTQVRSAPATPRCSCCTHSSTRRCRSPARRARHSGPTTPASSPKRCSSPASPPTPRRSTTSTRPKWTPDGPRSSSRSSSWSDRSHECEFPRRRRRTRWWWTPGYEPLTGPRAFEAQVVSVLVLVMVTTEPTEVPQRCRAAFRDRNIVIDLQIPVDVAALDRAFGEHLVDRSPESGRDRPPEMGHRAYVLAVHDQSLEDRVVAQAVRHGHRDGPDSRHLAHLTRLGMSPTERGVAHADDDGATRLGAPLASRRARPRDHSVEGKRVGPFTTARIAGSSEEITLKWLERRHDPSRGIGGPAHDHAAGSVAVPPR